MSFPSRRRDGGLQEVAKETKKVVRDVLKQLDPIDTTTSIRYHFQDLPMLELASRPQHKLGDNDIEKGRIGTRIRVVDQDSFDAAIALQPDTNTGNCKKPVAVLNLASERRPGGGWENGALAQEEALCYRSSLYLTLKPDYYPIPPLSGVYSPSVLIMRDALSRGHKLLFPRTEAKDLDVTAVLTVAAARGPKVARDNTYLFNADRELMKSKIRVILRMAALNGHMKLVLGALGCGAFGNPPKDVAQCYLEVFREDEFQGGWWEDIVFAVLDNVRGGGKEGPGNFGVFFRTLDGVVV
jgi:uncharacterized protein (TIGR02452 family)